jgi:xanthine dehydrogenase accessory factor
VRDELVELLAWQRAGIVFALATVVGTSSSAPRPAGAALAVHPDGRVVGNVSGGCVEPAVVELATAVLADGEPRRARFGYSDDEALAVGLTCGGSVDVLILRVDSDLLPLAPLAEALAGDEPVAVVTVVAAPSGSTQVGSAVVITAEAAHGALLATTLGQRLAQEGRGALAVGGTTLRHLGADGERMGDELSILVEAFAPRPHLIVFGAIDYAAALTTLARQLGYRVTVCDARARFATHERFPDADEVVVDWPHRFLARTPVDARTAVCVLTHDPKFDVPALAVALASPAGFIGAMGSRRTHEDRLRRLRASGVGESDLARLRSPIGLDLGGRSPQETAVSILAELVMVRAGGSGRPLSATVGPIHPDGGAVSAAPVERAGAVVLAAGSARRFGDVKLVAPLAGEPLIQHAVRRALGAGLAPVVVVLGHAAEQVRAALPLDARVHVVVNDDHAAGQAGSLRMGLAALDDLAGADIELAVILLGDQPDVPVTTLSAVVAAARQYGAVVSARYDDAVGPPVALPRTSWSAVAAAVRGDEGLRAVRGRFGTREVRIAGAAPRDVDTPGDLAELAGPTHEEQS